MSGVYLDTEMVKSADGCYPMMKSAVFEASMKSLVSHGLLIWYVGVIVRASVPSGIFSSSRTSEAMLAVVHCVAIGGAANSKY